MPLPATMDATWVNPGSVQYNAQELRRADAAMFGGTGAAFGVRGGIVRHGSTSLAVSVSGSDVLTVQPGAVVIPGNAGAGNGCYRTALGAAETGNLAARNATLPRVDLVVFRVLDTDVEPSHGAYTGRVEVLTGTPADSPVAPSLPTLAVELARVTVPQTGGAAATVDLTNRTFAATLGGSLMVTTAARLPASAALWEKAVALDTGTEYRWSGAAWIATTYRGRRTRDAAQSLNNGVSTAIAFDATPYSQGLTPVGSGFQVPVAGLWRVTAQVSVTNSGVTGILMVQISRSGGNNVAIARLPFAPNAPTVVNGSTVFNLAANETIGLLVFHNNGAARDTSSSPYDTFLELEYAGPA